MNAIYYILCPKKVKWFSSFWTWFYIYPVRSQLFDGVAVGVVVVADECKQRVTSVTDCPGEQRKQCGYCINLQHTSLVYINSLATHNTFVH